MSTVAAASRRLDRVLARLRLYRQPLSMAVDGAVVLLAWHATYLFRLGFERWRLERPDYDGWVSVAVIAAYLTVFGAIGIPRGIWRFSGFGEVKRLAFGCTVSGLLAAVAILMAQLSGVPRAVLALHPFVTLIGLCIVRMAYRISYEQARSRRTDADREVRRVIILGAGEATRRLMASIHQQGWLVLGLLDDDPAKLNARIGDATVLGRLDELARQRLLAQATHLIVALPGSSASQRRRAIEIASAVGLPVLTVPSTSELQNGQRAVERVRGVEPEDLLGREPVQLDEHGLSEMISGRCVLVTGAGGSIGSELCRQVARYGPARIVLYELSEFALYRVEQNLSEAFPRLPLARLLGDVKDLRHLRATFDQQRPDVIFHAAAFKHVPLMEEENAWAALQNNIVGTWNAATAAAELGVRRFVLISTDKAVNPTSVMGASKRAAEMVLSHLATLGTPTLYSAVRFGNVLGSSGSVIPKFKAQIERGGPLTVTHPEMTRYFMTVSEAARLVLQAAALAQSGQVHVLDMGEPVKILDVARQLIRLSGRRDGEIGIVYTGLRAGEKLYEELLADQDRTLPSRHPRLRTAMLHAHPTGEWVADLLVWLSTDVPPAPGALRAGLRQRVPEFNGAPPPPTAC